MKYTKDTYPEKVLNFLFDEELTYANAVLLFQGIHKIFGFNEKLSYENNRKSAQRIIILRDDFGNDIGRVCKHHDKVNIVRFV